MNNALFFVLFAMMMTLILRSLNKSTLSFSNARLKTPFLRTHSTTNFIFTPAADLGSAQIDQTFYSHTQPPLYALDALGSSYLSPSLNGERERGERGGFLL